MKPKCKWISRDEEGRPSCMHGPAHRAHRGYWRCRAKNLADTSAYKSTQRGRDVESIRRTRKVRAKYEALLKPPHQEAA